MRRWRWGGWAGLVLGWGSALPQGGMVQRQGVQGGSAVSSGRVDGAHSAGLHGGLASLCSETDSVPLRTRGARPLPRGSSAHHTGPQAEGRLPSSPAGPSGAPGGQQGPWSRAPPACALVGLQLSGQLVLLVEALSSVHAYPLSLGWVRWPVLGAPCRWVFLLRLLAAPGPQGLQCCPLQGRQLASMSKDS